MLNVFLLFVDIPATYSNSHSTIQVSTITVQNERWHPLSTELCKHSIYLMLYLYTSSHLFPLMRRYLFKYTIQTKPLSIPIFKTLQMEAKQRRVCGIPYPCVVQISLLSEPL